MLCKMPVIGTAFVVAGAFSSLVILWAFGLFSFTSSWTLSRPLLRDDLQAVSTVIISGLRSLCRLCGSLLEHVFCELCCVLCCEKSEGKGKFRRGRFTFFELSSKYCAGRPCVMHCYGYMLWTEEAGEERSDTTAWYLPRYGTIP